MKRRIFLFGTLAAALLLSGCGGARVLMRTGVDRMESFRVERFGIGLFEGRVGLAMYNGNRTAITFGSGRIELRSGGRTVGIATLREAVVVEPGSGRVEVPVRIRFPQGGIEELLGLTWSSLGGATSAKRPEVRIVGRIGIDRAGRKRAVVEFRRRIDEQTFDRFVGSLGGLIGLGINQ